jgi:hypothetical protein
MKKLVLIINFIHCVIYVLGKPSQEIMLPDCHCLSLRELTLGAWSKHLHTISSVTQTYA